MLLAVRFEQIHSWIIRFSDRLELLDFCIQGIDVGKQLVPGLDPQLVQRFENAVQVFKAVVEGHERLVARRSGHPCDLPPVFPRVVGHVPGFFPLNVIRDDYGRMSGQDGEQDQENAADATEFDQVPRGDRLRLGPDEQQPAAT